MFTGFVNKIKSYDCLNHDDILKTLEFAIKAHKGQKRNSGQDYITHPVSVASIVLDYLKDTSSIIAALLHDVVEDTHYSLDDISNSFSGEVAILVEGVTKLSKIKFRNSAQAKAENLRKFILSISKDIRILIIKLADRLHNLRTIKYLSNKEKQKEIALETLEIYVPLAERIGIVSIKDELEDLCFDVLYPNIRDIILQKLETYKCSINIDLENIEKSLNTLLVANKVKNFLLEGRIKRPYSIWNKMQKDELDFEEINDLVAFRIIVNKVEECYKVLGIIHTNYKSFFSSFRDYISVSKDNGYQSIHTCIPFKPALKIELQIRTQEMNKVAKNGLAAHWSYKQHVKPYDMREYMWLNNILEIVSSPFLEAKEKYEYFKLEMFGDEIFVFTPKGKIISLPKGSIVLDFAYAIHTDIGNTCKGAKINGKFVPPYHELENGCTIKIITCEKQEPDLNFINLVKTGCAISNIRRYWRNKKKEKVEELIKNILDYTLKKEGLEYNDNMISKILEKYRLSTLEFYYGLLQGSITINEIIKDFYPLHFLNNKKSNPKFFVINQNKNINIPNIINSNIYLADCCLPVKGEELVGVLSLGQTIIAHRENCKALYLNKDKQQTILVDIDWAKKISETFLTKITLELTHRPGIIFDVSKVFKNHNINIIDFSTGVFSSSIKLINVTFEVKNIWELNKIIKELEALDIVKEIRRE